MTTKDLNQCCFFSVYSKDIKWVPIGRQAEFYPQGEKTLGVLDENILICKMRPGQEIHVFMHAVKGIGKDHAKFSPVGKATKYKNIKNIIKIEKSVFILFSYCCFLNSYCVVQNVARDKNHSTNHRRVSRTVSKMFQSRCN